MGRSFWQLRTVVSVLWMYFDLCQYEDFSLLLTYHLIYKLDMGVVRFELNSAGLVTLLRCLDRSLCWNTVYCFDLLGTSFYVLEYGELF